MRNSKTSRSLAAIAACAALVSMAFAQRSAPDIVTAVKAAGPIKLDGVLDEADWAKSPRISNFTQRELDENRPATEKTEVAILFSSTDLFIGLWCWDSDAAGITAQRMKWDFDYDTEDNVRIVIDTYQDKRNGYLFVVNPNGAQFDALIMDNGRKENENWNGVWYAAVRRTEEGWFAEIRIPFSTLKFGSAEEQAWGFNVERDIRRKRELALWQGWSRDAEIVQVNRAGTLQGLRGLTRMGLFEFRPYLMGGVQKDIGAAASTVSGLGLDFDYLINPTVKLDFTINPDFGQVESDEMIVNLTRFSISLPEKRQFFLEAQNFFDFPLGQARPFYSRRIGIYRGQETPILGGARFLGKMGGATLGAMVLQTGRTDAVGSTNFSLVRWKQDLGEQSSVGMLAIGEARSGRFNGTGGADALYSTSSLFGDKNFQIGGAFAATYTSDRETAVGTAHRVFAAYPNDLLMLSASWERAGKDFNPEVGFMSRTSYQLFAAELAIAPRPKFLPWVRQMEFKPLELEYYIDDATREMQSVYMEFRPLGMSLKSGESFELNIQRNAENLTEDFEIRDGHLIRAGRYWSTRGEIQFETYDGRPLVAGLGLNWGRFYDGTSTEYEAQLDWKPNKYLNLSLAYQRNDIRLPDGGFAIDEIEGRLNASLTPRLFGSVLTQWNNDENRILFNLRVTWIPKPGASLYFALNQFGDRLDPHDAWRLAKTVVMLKFVWYFSLP